MEILRLLAVLLPISVSSGINLYATVLTAGLAVRFGWIKDIPAGFDVLGHWLVITVAATFFVLEFLADKVQFIDNLLDAIHSFIRPLGASLLTVAVIGQLDPLIAVIAGLFAGSIALLSHGGKAGSRLALNAVTPAENVSNITVSVVEDILASSLTFLALRYPYHAAVVAILLLGLIVYFVPIFIRTVLFTLGSMLKLLISLFLRVANRMPNTDELPLAHQNTEDKMAPLVSGYCQARSLVKMGGRSGYLSVFPSQLTFSANAGKKFFEWTVPFSEILDAKIINGFLIDYLELTTVTGKKKQRVRFVFQKDRANIAKTILENLPAQAGIQTNQKELA